MKTNPRSLFQRTRTPALVAVSVSLSVILGQVVMAQAPKVIPPKNVKEEYVIYGSANLSGGETSVAVDPTDPNHIIVGVLATKNLPFASGELPNGTADQDSRRAKEAHAYCVF